MRDDIVDEKRGDQAFRRRAAFRGLAGGGSGGVGPHCGSKRLIAYRQGTLSAVEREAVQEHLSLCPRCTGLLRELRDFEAAAARGEAGPESLRHEAWDSLVRRLPAKTPAVRPVAGAREAQRRWRPPHLAGAAAALLLAVIGLASWATVTVLEERQRLTRLEQRLAERDAALTAVQSSLAETERRLGAARGRIRDLEEERSDGIPGREDAASAGPARPDRRVDELAARVAELTAELAQVRRATPAPERPTLASREVGVTVTPLYALRGQETSRSSFLRPGGVPNPVPRSSREDAREERFTVKLSLADRPVYDEYRLELLDRDGRALWNGRRPAGSFLGDAGAELAVYGLGSGLYRLRIEGLRPDRGELVAEYLLQVR